MTVIERIKETARQKKNMSLTVLEQTLGYSNGSLSKAKDIPSSRIMEIADFLNVSMEYLMTGQKETTAERIGRLFSGGGNMPPAELEKIVKEVMSRISTHDEATEEPKPTTLAAHFDGEEYTEEELEEIKQFAEFVKNRRK